MSADRDHLFVYGTLLAGDKGLTGRAQRARLARQSRPIGAATTEGRLYHLGRYPGLVRPAAPAGIVHGEIVHGEVLELASPEQTLRWLDAYEEIVPGQHPHNPYERLRVVATLVDGRHIEAWTYLYRGPLAGTALMPGGRWLR